MGLYADEFAVDRVALVGVIGVKFLTPASGPH